MAFLFIVALAGLPATAPVMAADAAPPPDIVRTKDGGMMRGTIIESVPNQRVDIMLPNGQTRTVTMTDIVYAGPASADPSAAPPVAAPSPPSPKASSGPIIHAPTVRIELKGDQDGLTFHQMNGSSRGFARGGLAGTEIETTHHQRLCSVPCEVELPRGTYQFGLTLGGSRVLETGAEFALNGNARLHGRIESRGGVRLTGWMIIASAIVVGAIVAVHDRHKECNAADICDDRFPYALPGLGIMAVGGGLGAYMAVQSDRAEIDIR